MGTDVVIIGSGIFGLYAGRLFARKGKNVVIIERDSVPFSRASLVNQARLHQGYHYPRSPETGQSARAFYQRFREEFHFAMNSDFRQIYGLAKHGSLTSANDFEAYCQLLGLPFREIKKGEFFHAETIEKSYLVEEETFDTALIADYLRQEVSSFSNLELRTGLEIDSATVRDQVFLLKLNSGEVLEASAVVNTTYSGINQIHRKFNFPEFNLDYELAEILMGRVPPKFENVGLTVLDGPFFSLMPWGLSGQHSLTAVSLTPRFSSVGPLPSFPCMQDRKDCNSLSLKNCNSCHFQPESSGHEMIQLARSFLGDEFALNDCKSYFAVKAILAGSTDNDSRPTIVKSMQQTPHFVSILAGKINTVFRVEDLLKAIQ